MQRLHFDDFVLDRGRRELRRGDESIHVSPKAFHLLEMLVDAAPNAVSKDDLYRGLWPDTFVAEANLPNLIKELRNALDEDSRGQKLIRTLHGFGYAFNELPRPDGGATKDWSVFVAQWFGREFPLRQGENVAGRDAGADIRIDSSGVSRRHASILVDGTSVAIRDLGSKNGTFVDGIRIVGEMPLSDNSEIQLGSATLRIRRIGPGETTMTVSPADARS